MGNLITVGLQGPVKNGGRNGGMKKRGDQDPVFGGFLLPVKP